MYLHVCYELQKIFSNFVSLYQDDDCHDYIGQISDQVQNLRSSYKILIRNICKELVYTMISYLKHLLLKH